MQKVLIGFFTLVLLGVIGYQVYTSRQKGNDNATQQVEGQPVVTITRTAAGYEPKEVTVKKGDIVLWKNESEEYHWPASDLHPTHAIYSAFDPLMPIAPGDEWKFKFDQVGVWKYHDHIRANKVGAITVTE
jgi:plastocyanin